MALLFFKNVSIEIFIASVVFQFWFILNKISSCSICNQLVKIRYTSHKGFTVFQIDVICECQIYTTIGSPLKQINSFIKP